MTVFCVPPQLSPRDGPGWRAGLAAKQVQRLSVRHAAIEFLDRRGECRIGRHRAEQGHRGTEFEIVGTAQDFPDGSALDGVDERRALPKPGSQDAVPEIGRGLVARANRKPLRHRAMPEAGKLRKNEPHPVTLLLAPAQFGKDARINRRLRLNETLEIGSISHGAGLAPDWHTT